MKNIFLLLTGFFFCSGVTFGQNILGFKAFPNKLNKLKTFPSISDLSMPGFTWFPNNSGIIEGELSFLEKHQPMALVNKKKLSDKGKALARTFSEQDNMPIIDLSKGFSSNLHIKIFPEDYPSNMPIIPGRTQIIQEGLNVGDAPIIIPDARNP
ncbi:hypothetical protein [Cyclobacterium sp.]|uniref:hypothetical protein n=1 Tax=Cyclobacterium sp. TaxID=1966343 RepID=UPI0019A23F0B|nr:hypothetical protein [Cyclobacterium sp.]MBD3628568.1 hypothetical protein [Cyclobacterium sp.]